VLTDSGTIVRAIIVVCKLMGTSRSIPTLPLLDAFDVLSWVAFGAFGTAGDEIYSQLQSRNSHSGCNFSSPLLATIGAKLSIYRPWGSSGVLVQRLLAEVL